MAQAQTAQTQTARTQTAQTQTAQAHTNGANTNDANTHGASANALVGGQLELVQHQEGVQGAQRRGADLGAFGQEGAVGGVLSKGFE